MPGLQVCSGMAFHSPPARSSALRPTQTSTHATPLRSKHPAWRTLRGPPRPPTEPFEPSRQAWQPLVKGRRGT